MLIEKWDHYGVRGNPVDLNKSYLPNRQQCLQHNSDKSSLLNIKTGVPQGSILRPLLFLVYINNVFNISDVAEYIGYADDMRIFITGTNFYVMIVCTNSVLALLSKWMNRSHLIIYLQKANAMFLSFAKQPDIYKYFLT